MEPPILAVAALQKRSVLVVAHSHHLVKHRILMEAMTQRMGGVRDDKVSNYLLECLQAGKLEARRVTLNPGEVHSMHGSRCI